MNVEILVRNTSSAEAIKYYKYLVIKLIDGEFWYYGAGHDYEECKMVASKLGNAFIVSNPEFVA